MRTKVVVKETPNGFHLETDYGFPIGPRMHSIAPKQGSNYPEVPSGPFTSEFEANVAKLEWNTYLLHAWKNRSKSKSRSSE
jgi:hypothetical protein